MARNAYVTHRAAPNGYVAVTKPLAKILYERGVDTVIAGNNVNTFHIVGGWVLGWHVSADTYSSFEKDIRSFMCQLDRALGTYPVFYVRSEEVK